MLTKLKLFSSVFWIAILCFSCVESNRNHVGFVSNNTFLGMNIDEFKEKEYGVFNYESSNKDYKVYTNLKDAKFDSVYTIAESYYFDNQDKLKKVEFAITMKEYKVDVNNFENVLNNCCNEIMYLKKSHIDYQEGNYPRVILTWQ